LEEGFLKSAAGIKLNAYISRSDAAKLLAAFLELEQEAEMKNPFIDTEDPAVLALYHTGIVDGTLEDKRRYFKGEDSIKRSELCKILSLGKEYVEENFISIMGDRVKINFDLPMNELDESRFLSYKDRIYYDDASMDIRYGVDVSQHQYDIDWKALAADGFDYAIIRIGYRGYTEGKMSIDPYFEKNMKGAAEAGLDVGVYFFSQATSVEEALEEADYVLEAIEGYEINYPVVFDWEPMFVGGSRTAAYDGDIVTDASIAFMNRIAEAGYMPMTYYNKSIAYLKLDLEKLDGYPVWLAQYATEAPDYIYRFDMWQYGTAQVDGVEGECDVNISFRDFAKTHEESHE
ncbi:MAG: glycoside hydrolase family 25 protein, partial [Oscillospiraceae bacterium]|nr:glycoside hydrolase family 25 protein [Oscillospiraceae bacterium]